MMGFLVFIPSAVYASGPTLTAQHTGYSCTVNANPFTCSSTGLTIIAKGDVLVLMYVVASGANNAVTSFVTTDSLSNSYTDVALQCAGASNTCTGIAFAVETAACSSCTITFHSEQTGTTAGTFNVYLQEWTGFASTVKALTGTGSCTAACTTSFSTSSVSFATTSYIGVSAVAESRSGVSGTWAAGSSFTLDTDVACANNANSGCAQYSNTVTSATTFSMTDVGQTINSWAESGAIIYNPQNLNTYTASIAGGGANFPASGTVTLEGTQVGAVNTAACTISVGGSSSASCNNVYFDNDTAVAFTDASTQSTATDQWSASPLTYGLIGYWPLDEGLQTTAFDLSGKANTGTLQASPTWLSGASCKFGACLGLASASSQFVSVPSSSSLQLSTGTMTFTAWIRETSLSDCQEIIDKVGSSSEWDFRMCGASNVLELLVGDGSSYVFPSAPLTLSLNTWTFVAASFDGVSQFNFYSNGVSIGSSTNAKTLATNTAQVEIGAQTGGTDFVNGRLDDVRAYNRVLTASEILELYTMTVPTLEFVDISGSNTRTVSYYDELSNSLKVSPLAQITFDGSLTFTPTFAAFGSAISPTIITTMAGDVSDTATVWSDYNQGMTAPQLLGGAASNTRWQNTAGAASTAGTPTTGGNTYNTNYYKQLTETWTADLASYTGARTVFDASGMTGSVIGTILGTASTTICSFSTTNNAATATCTGYIDYNQAGTFSTILTNPPSNQRWICGSCTTSAQTSGGGTPTVGYYGQWSLNGLYSSLTTSITVTRTSTGSSNVVSSNDWYDYATSIQVNGIDSVTYANPNMPVYIYQFVAVTSSGVFHGFQMLLNQSATNVLQSQGSATFTAAKLTGYFFSPSVFTVLSLFDGSKNVLGTTATVAVSSGLVVGPFQGSTSNWEIDFSTTPGGSSSPSASSSPLSTLVVDYGQIALFGGVFALVSIYVGFRAQEGGGKRKTQREITSGLTKSARTGLNRAYKELMGTQNSSKPMAPLSRKPEETV